MNRRLAVPFTVVKEQMHRKKERMLFGGCAECEMKTGIWESVKLTSQKWMSSLR